MKGEKIMSTSKKLLSLLLCLTMIVSGFSFAFAGTAYDEADSYMKEVVETLGAHIDGEDMMDDDTLGVDLFEGFDFDEE